MYFRWEDPSRPWIARSCGEARGPSTKSISTKSPSGVLQRARVVGTSIPRRNSRLQIVCRWRLRAHHAGRKGEAARSGLGDRRLSEPGCLVSIGLQIRSRPGARPGVKVRSPLTGGAVSIPGRERDIFSGRANNSVGRVVTPAVSSAGCVESRGQYCQVCNGRARLADSS
jgi:hypothetical protein